jgi:electron transfer flavoprotein alpha subunit
VASVLVIGEVTENGQLSATSAELLGAATRLAADLGGGVACALVGEDLDAAAQAAVAAGADTVYTAVDVTLAQYQTEAYVPVAAAMIQQDVPQVVLMGQTSVGRDAAPRLAARLGTGVVMDAVELAVTDGRVRATRPCFGGNARQVVTIATDPQIITVRAKSEDPLALDTGRSGSIAPVAVDPVTPRARLTGKEQAQAEGVPLNTAEIVVSGGRGLGDEAAFHDLEELASILGAAVGASRAACDLGWYPPSQQVGLTGTVVSPTLYLAVAISGASQHMAGCGGAKNIVAINKDADANIYSFCRFGVVEDYKKVLPPLTAALRELVD